MSKPLKIVNKHFGVLPERLSEASPSRPACAECRLHESCSDPFMKPYIPEYWTGKYVFVIEVTKSGEEAYRRNGLPLGERERTQLKAILEDSTIERNDVAFVTVLRCRPQLTGSKKAKMLNLRACRPFLIRAVQELNPETVMVFGKSALKGILNTGSIGPIALLRGRNLAQRCLPVFTCNVFVTSELSSLLTDPHTCTRITEDLRRLSLPELKHPIKSLPKGKIGEIGFDTEYGPVTGGSNGATGVYSLGVSDSNHALAVIPQQIGILVPVLKDAVIVGHNLPVDIESLLRLQPKGLKIALEQWLQGRRQRDTLLEARLSDENRGRYGYKLESLAVSLFNTKDWKKATEDLGPDSSIWPPQLRDERCRLDAWATLQIHHALEKTVEGPSRLSHAIAMSLRRMYWAGVYIDEKKFTEIRTKVYKERKKSFQVTLQFAKQFGMEEGFTAKDAQLREYVYGRNGVGLEVESYTKGGLPSVSVKHLKEYKDDEAIQALLTFSKFDKLQSTYCDSLASKFVQVGSQWWMAVAINPLAAKTGRRSSNAPNFQNWPVSVRQIIVSRFTGGSIADNDYSKLEPILGGWVAGEPKLTEYFVKYPNGYIKIGEDFFKKSVVKNTKEYTSIKSLVLGITYNKKKWSLAEDIWSQGVKFDGNYERHIDLVGDMLEDFLDMFPKMRDYHQQQEEEVLSTGKVYNALGQCRRLPLPPEPPRGEKGVYRAWMKHKAHVINQAINYPIQCHVEGTNILTDDLRWIKVEALREGDKLLGFDEHRTGGHQQQYRIATVLYAKPANAECFEVITQAGKRFIVTKNHLHLTQNAAGHKRWVTTDMLNNNQYGSNLVKLIEYAEVVESKEAGYIAGMFDADGCLSVCETSKKGTSWELSFGQCDNSARVEVYRILDKFGFTYRIDIRNTRKKQKEFWNVELLGGKPEVIRFLMMFRPKRLLDNFVKLSHKLGRIQSLLSDHVVAVNPCGMKPVIQLQTSTATYIAEGYATHNSLAAYVTGCGLVDVEKEFLSHWKWSYIDYQTALMEKKWPHIPLLCIEVHDDLVQDIPKGLEKKTKEITHEIMQKPPSLFAVLPELWDSNVKLSVETNNSPCWGMKT